ncbi:MAG: hypothetical protein PGN13_13495 [Patulibacter minatonensis]
MIDLHCHLLPGLDDGPADLEATFELARAQVSAGVEKVLCTPHVNHGYPANVSTAIIQRTQALRRSLHEAGIPLRIQAGAEVAVTKAVELDDTELELLHLGAGPWLLLEAPLSTDFPQLDGLVAGLRARGHEILLAHPERCALFHRDPALLAGLIARGAAAQVTATSLTGDFGRTVERFARSMVEDGLVHVIASDAHSARRRGPGLAGPLTEAGLDWLTDYACAAVPGAMLAGESLPGAPELPRKRRRFGRG